MPALLERLNKAGVKDRQISCIMALGTHRYMSETEIINKVGKEVYDRISVFNHEWKNRENLTDLGKTPQGTPIIVNKAVLEADVLIGLGSVVPHHIPGYSGSSKIIQPGICGSRTTAETHLLSCSHGGGSFLGLPDNPIRRDMDSMAQKVNLKTIFNTVLNDNGAVVGIFFGEIYSTFQEAVKLARRIYGVKFHEEADIVIANSCPCDFDFWQAHKALYPAEKIVKDKGTIIVTTPSPEGVSSTHQDILRYTSWSPKEIRLAYQKGELTDGVAVALATAWAMVREKANIITYSPGISPDEKQKLGHTHAPSIGWAIEEAFRRQGSDARITVLTHAPDTLPLEE